MFCLLGTGKTTASLTLFPDILESFDFVNADEITQELRQKNPGTSDITAGRIMLERINNLLESNQNFAIETTLASKSLKNTIKRRAHRRNSGGPFFYAEY